MDNTNSSVCCSLSLRIIITTIWEGWLISTLFCVGGLSQGSVCVYAVYKGIWVFLLTSTLTSRWKKKNIFIFFLSTSLSPPPPCFSCDLVNDISLCLSLVVFFLLGTRAATYHVNLAEWQRRSKLCNSSQVISDAQ